MRAIGAVAAGLLGFALFFSATPAQPDVLTPSQIFQASQRAVVVIRKTNPLGATFRGTGFFISPNLIATNHHVVADAQALTIEGAEESVFTFRRVLAEDPAADTAVIEIAEQSPYFLTLDPVMRVEVGETVYVIGNPHGYARSLSQGLVSGIRSRSEAGMYQITANVSEGSSGSPVLDGRGRVIGIVFGRLPHEAQIAFATPVANLVALRDGGWRPDGDPAARGIRTSRNLPPGIRPASLPPSTPPGTTAKAFLRIGVPNWDSAVVMAHLFKASLEEMFPIGVELMPATNEEIFSGIANADRTFDIHPDVWLPNHRRFVTDRVRLTKANYGGAQGICVPRYVLANYSVRRRADLADPTVARLFDVDGDERGELWIGEEGWESAKIERLMARDYRYDTYFDLVTGTERDLYRWLDTAIAARQPVAFYCYGPHWVLRKHDLTILRDRAHSSDCFRLADSESGRRWYDNSYASCAGPATTVHRAYSDHVARSLPAVAAFLEAFAIDYEELNGLIFHMMGSGRDNAAVARAWVRRNEQTLRRYMGAGAN